ncbi:MAG: aspartate-semialdehyde dehydrogenase [Rhodobacter sp.]|uniref:aspartate-semialdehyde dehydrogenase n=1 Tax=Pararhodobacter sp. TaxID=2127056 RepID=UPI001DD4D5FC|nr:aspartate-semialdehyde dehydrogenase [Pararhodobacter sp.]MCB1344018.1 aspartate-semialdehyde dehydrogenase [Paracoccaceae bacterium]MCC0072151.1 aspartate-semialdehyde dehydrogenase [Rhodobacter sp.]HPD91906.1 aspartate-semialdehyde dehydrogenase [Pararhodobacter sp.]
MTDLSPPLARAADPLRINRRLPAHPVVAIVGATGAVGIELIESLTARDFPVAALRLLASARSAGTRLTFRGRELVVQALTEDSFAGVDVAFFSAGAAVSRDFAPLAVRAGAVVVDNSSAFRMAPEVPLVVPEVNAPAMDQHAGIIANPNCVAAILTVALAPLAQAARIRRLNVATYQAASGAGAAAMEELRQATGAYLDGRAFSPRVLPHPYAFNMFSHNAAVDPDTGYNGEEEKVIAETRRILGRPDLPVSITCIRVPVLRAHGMAVTVEFDAPLSVAEARRRIAAAPGLRLVDDRAANHFPMPVEASGQEDVLVGRLRQDLGDPSGRSLALFVVGDQLLKGAALNAVQIAEALLPR